MEQRTKGQTTSLRRPRPECRNSEDPPRTTRRAIEKRRSRAGDVSRGARCDCTGAGVAEGVGRCGDEFPFAGYGAGAGEAGPELEVTEEPGTNFAYLGVNL